MIQSEKHVTFHESSFEKSPSPKRFQEPDDMISVELNYVAETTKNEKPCKFQIKTVHKKLIKLFIFIGLLALGSLTFILITRKSTFDNVILEVTDQYIAETSSTTENVIYYDIEKCLQTKEFEDCCMYENENGKYLTHSDCTVNKILTIFMEYEEYYSQTRIPDFEINSNMKNDEVFVTNLKRKRRETENFVDYDQSYQHNFETMSSDENEYDENQSYNQEENLIHGSYENNAQSPNFKTFEYFEDNINGISPNIQNLYSEEQIPSKLGDVDENFEPVDYIPKGYYMENIETETTSPIINYNIPSVEKPYINQESSPKSLDNNRKKHPNSYNTNEQHGENMPNYYNMFSFEEANHYQNYERPNIDITNLNYDKNLQPNPESFSHDDVSYVNLNSNRNLSHSYSTNEQHIPNINLPTTYSGSSSVHEVIDKPTNYQTQDDMHIPHREHINNADLQDISSINTYNNMPVAPETSSYILPSANDNNHAVTNLKANPILYDAKIEQAKIQNNQNAPSVNSYSEAPNLDKNTYNNEISPLTVVALPVSNYAMKPNLKENGEQQSLPQEIGYDKFPYVTDTLNFFEPTFLSSDNAIGENYEKNKEQLTNNENIENIPSEISYIESPTTSKQEIDKTESNYYSTNLPYNENNMPPIYNQFSDNPSIESYQTFNNENILRNQVTENIDASEIIINNNNNESENNLKEPDYFIQSIQHEFSENPILETTTLIPIINTTDSIYEQPNNLTTAPFNYNKSNNAELNKNNDERNSFINDEESNADVKSVSARDFQGQKSKINQFQTANIDLQTSQHSMINSNFNQRPCQIIGSPYPFTQQLPFNYDANQGTQFAQLIPVTVPKSNSYIVPPYNFVQPNYAYQPVNNPYSVGYNTYYNGLQNLLATQTASLQATGPTGHYYICNPIAPPTNNIINTPGVEIRDGSVHNLQDLLDGSVNFQEVNNKTRASDKCPFNEHMCADNMKCIERDHICDGHVHCNDASDEAYCSCKYRVGSARLCDGYFDCPNGEDELGCFGCSINLFSCDDWTEDDKISTCVPLEERCDGISQCPTGKDEEDCSILTDKIADHQMNKISNSIGFLHHNFKGKWYPACSNPEAWARDACDSESGPSNISPLTHMIPTQFTYKGLYVNSLEDNDAELVPSCVPGRAVYVECPEPTCGIRKLFRNPYRPEEVDTSVENFLSRLPRHRRQLNATDSILRVVGGKPSQPAAWPWVVSVYRNGIFHCGGAIINPGWVITAAHCVDKYWQYYYEIEAGILRRFSYSPMEQNRFVSHVIPHKDFDRANLKNDLALMRLSAPLRYNRYVRPICLPNEFTAGPNFYKGPLPGTICTAVGWGATVEHGADPDHLREVDVPILSHCKHIEDEIGNEICAGLSEGGRDACQGDSGGPFLCKNPVIKNQWYLAGIVSHGEGCARPNEPGVYTRVSKYENWIFQHATNLVLPKLVPLNSCPGYTCRLTNRCLPKRRRCDKIIDCLVGDDEMNCEASSFTNLFKHAIRQMYETRTNNDENILTNNVKEPTKIKNEFEDKINENVNKKNVSSKTVNKPEYDLSTTENSTSFATSPYISDKNDNITNIKDTTFLYTDITTENYKIDESEKELILKTETQITTTEFAYAAVSNDIVSRLSNGTDKIDATFLCKRMLQVIPLTKRCNKIVDCQDATDEENCKCLDYLRSTTPSAICDGITDCYDLSDENSCVKCKSDEFRCRKTNKCIPYEKKCDGTSDCPLDEDEWDCVTLTNGVTVYFDEDMRPILNMKGIISINNNGSWKALCANWSGIEPSTTASDVCLSLGFTDYKKFQQLSVDNQLLNTSVIRLDSVLDDEKIVLNQDKCDALYVKCSNITVDLTHQIGTESKFTVTHNLYTLPWNAAIYVDGKYECIGVILNSNWILTSVGCFNKTTSLYNRYVAALLGTMRPYLDVGGPHDQMIRIVDFVTISNTNLFMLRLGKDIKITRYVRTALFHWRNYAARNKETCVAIDKNLKLLYLKPLYDCDIGERCFKRIKRNVSRNCPDDEPSSGYIMCDFGNGWYPAALYENKSIQCDFRRKESYTSVSYHKKQIFKAIERDAFVLEAPTCSGYRCKLGLCIDNEKVCDGIPDCRNAEDENDFCIKWREQCNLTDSCYCLPSELRCLNGKCVQKSSFCDNINDCGDGSDEPDVCSCGTYLNLANNTKLCDGEINCFDKSDEDPNICKCADGKYSCKDSTLCIAEGALCDGTKDCPKGDDEEFCISLTTSNSSPNVGEVYVRTSGVWHSGCFPKNMTMTELNDVCIKLGFKKIYSSYMYLSEIENGLKSKRPILDKFTMVFIRNDAKDLKFPIRNGDVPFVTFKDDDSCNKLFIECT